MGIRTLTVVVVALVLSLSGCSEIADEASKQLTEAVKQEAQAQIDQAKQDAKDSVDEAIDSAKESVGIGKSIKPDLNSAAYAGDNPFSEYSGHCTWFAWGRAYEKWNAQLPMRGNAGEWYDDPKGSDLTHSSEPRADSIAVWRKGDYGHVAYVEEVNGDSLVINEANWENASFGQHGSGYTGAPVTVRTADMGKRYGTFMGYIYVPK